ncbi:hypothetical protein [Psychrobacter sp. I-STPA6b]|uniref:hypothetical protein n=1 Tax=Psychrobacter sp. I-STPA6b TaxID=2585718 RepID=UPI001D0CB4B3|nr:hypothetical protein [Psychrobacter sp. I-STPA6b]
MDGEGSQVRDNETKNFSEYFTASIKPSRFVNPNLYFGSGGSSLTTTGNFVATRIGRYTNVSGTIIHTWEDLYNWDEGKSTPIGVFNPDYFRDDEARYLVEQGFASDFNIKSQWSGSFKGIYDNEKGTWKNADFK